MYLLFDFFIALSYAAVPIFSGNLITFTSLKVFFTKSGVLSFDFSEMFVAEYNNSKYRIWFFKENNLPGPIYVHHEEQEQAQNVWTTVNMVDQRIGNEVGVTLDDLFRTAQTAGITWTNQPH